MSPAGKPIKQEWLNHQVHNYNKRQHRKEYSRHGRLGMKLRGKKSVTYLAHPETPQGASLPGNVQRLDTPNQPAQAPLSTEQAQRIDRYNGGSRAHLPSQYK